MLKEILAAKSFPPVLLIIGKDRTRRERCLDHLLTKHGLASSQVEKNSGEAFSLGSLKDTLLSPSLFSASTCIVVSGFQDIRGYSPADLKTLIILQFSMNPPSSLLVFIEDSLPSNHPIRTMLTERQCVAEFTPLEGSELEEWITKEITRQKLTASSQKITATIASMCDGDLDEAAALISRLALFLNENEPITEETLEALFPEHISAHEFTLVDQIISGERTKALFELTRLINLKKNVFGILGLLTKNVTTLLSIAALRTKGSTEGDISRVLKLPPWLLKKHLTAATKLGQQRLEDMLAHLGKAEILLKSKSLGETVTMERLVTALTRP